MRRALTVAGALLVASAARAGWLSPSPVTGPADLDLSGTTLYAVSLGSLQDNLVAGKWFEGDNDGDPAPVGYSVVAPNMWASGWGTGSITDPGLQRCYDSMRYRLNAPVQVTLQHLPPGQQVRVQLLLSEGFHAGGGRAMDIDIEGVSEFTNVDAVTQWGFQQPGLGTATPTVSADGVLDIVVSPAAGASDRNPVLDGVIVSADATPAGLKPIPLTGSDVTASATYDGRFPASKVVDGSWTDNFASDYWLLPSGQTGFLQFDLGERTNLQFVEIHNTDNSPAHQDRGTLAWHLDISPLADFSVAQTIAAGTLQTWAQGWHRVPLGSDEFWPYARFYVDDYSGSVRASGGGLNEIVFYGYTPEPGTLVLLGGGVLALGRRRRRNRHPSHKKGDLAMARRTLGLILAASLVLGGALPAAANPATIANLQAWYHADAISGLNPGDPVDTWPDPTTGNHATSSGSARPTYVPGGLAGKPVVRFDATDDTMTTPIALNAPDTYTLFALFSYNSTASAFRRAVQGSNNWLIGPYNNGVRHYAGGWVTSPGPAVTPGQFYLAQARNDGSASRFAVDGVDRTNNSTHTGRPGTVYMAGQGAYPAEILDGDMAEVIIYNRALTPLEQHQVGAYVEATYRRDTPYVSAPYGQNVIADGARVYYQFREATGAASAHNASTLGASRNGSYQGNPTLGLPGIPTAPFPYECDTAAHFDGLDDQVRISDALDPAAYTLEAWVRAEPGATTSRSLVVRTSGSGPSTHWSQQLRINAAGQLEHYIWDQGASTGRTVTGSTVIQPDVWYYVAGTLANGGWMRLFVNGLEEGTALPVTTAWTGGDRWLLGSVSGHGMGHFQGLMDEFALYTSVLSPDQINARYLDRLPEPGTLALLGGGVLALARSRRRRHAAPARRA